MMAQPLARAQWNAGWYCMSCTQACMNRPLSFTNMRSENCRICLRRIVVVTALARELARLREAGNAHVQIVEPQGIRQRPIARQRAVLEAELLRRHVLHVVVDPRAAVVLSPRPAQLGLDERRAHRAGIIERARQQRWSCMLDAMRRTAGSCRAWCRAADSCFACAASVAIADDALVGVVACSAGRR